MDKQTLFENGEITFVNTRSGGHYRREDFVLGVSGNMLAAIDRQYTKQVTFIPLTAVESIGVEYEHEQVTVQDTPSTGPA